MTCGAFSPSRHGQSDRGAHISQCGALRRARELIAAALTCLAAGCTGDLVGEWSGGDEGVDAGAAPLDARPSDALPLQPDAGDSTLDAGMPSADAEVPDAAASTLCGDSLCGLEENPWECSDDCGMPSIPPDFAGVVWLHTNVSSWSETATLSGVEMSGGLICLPYDKAEVWPGVDHVDAFVNANPWIFIYHQGTLYAATWEWMRHGQSCKNESSVAGDHIKQSPFWDFQPQSGTWYGFMVSGLARDSVRNAEERSNVVLFRWP